MIRDRVSANDPHDSAVRRERTRLAMQQGMLWSARPAAHGGSHRLRAFFHGVGALLMAPFYAVASLVSGRSRSRRQGYAIPRQTQSYRVQETGEAISIPEAASKARISPRLLVQIVGFSSLGILFVFGIVFGAYLVKAAARPHTLIAGNGMLAEVVVPFSQPEELIAHYGIALGSHDRLLSDERELGTVLYVDRLYPTYITADSDFRDIWMNGGTVADALNRAGVLVRSDDLVTPDLSQPLSPGTSIEVVRVEREFITELQKIDFKTTRKKDDTVTIGERVIKQKGIDGERRIVTELVYHNGELYSSDVIENVITQESQTLIVHEGTKPKATPAPKATPTPAPRAKKADSISSPDANGIVTITVSGKKYRAIPMVVEITAYTHTGNRTATGTKPKVGTVAVDRDVIPLGTKMFVPGYGMGKAEDVGVGGDQIDIFMETTKECLRWGRKRNVTIYLLQ